MGAICSCLNPFMENTSTLTKSQTKLNENTSIADNYSALKIFLVAFSVYISFNWYVSSFISSNNNSIDNKKPVSSNNDHIYLDIEKIQMSFKQYELIKNSFNSPKLKSKELLSIAKTTGLQITPHLLYRYYQSSDWSPKFYGKNYDDAVIETITWRNNFGFKSLKLSDLESILKSKLIYTNGYDKHGRVIIYVKFSPSSLKFDKKEYIKAILNTAIHTVERADLLSIRKGSGEFSVIIDLKGLSWSSCPPINVISKIIGLLKRHYPYRLHTIYILNIGMIFDAIWNLVRPMVPPRALRKTLILNKNSNFDVLLTNLGNHNIEKGYGGILDEPDFSDDKFLLKYFNYLS